MPINSGRARQLLKDFNFSKLFIEELGWDQHHALLNLTIGTYPYALTAIAHKRGMVAYHCPASAGESMPGYTLRRKIEHQVAKSAHEHLIIFTDTAKLMQIWQWVKREAGKPTACREHTFYTSQPGDALLQKLEAIAFSLDEEDKISLPDVTGRARTAFDVERVTKRFYDQFQKEHAAFLKFITGITEQADHEWYASVMLNRLMFVYFMQRKGFLDGDRDYLRNRLSRCRKEKGHDKFYSFYRYFLLRLFHEGLGERKREPELEKLIGRVPYLNGGIFDKHELERPERYGKAIQIPDKAFERIFNYFDQYQWHLDERPLRSDDEINPDVLGYIFEKYINQKQMGAYYTKEDITEYISTSTVLPFLFEAAKPKCKISFENAGGPTIWDLLRRDPDRYIHEAVQKGMDNSLPADIAAGLKSIAGRTQWNKLAPMDYSLPTEIWREVVVRRKRCEQLRHKLAGGEIRGINDFITLNLDIRQFAQDVIENCEGPDLLRAFWQAIENVTILDPACGSGAFLFAALNILEPLYEACLERMDAFVADLDRSIEKARPEQFSDFRQILERVAAHPNRRYFIFKSIILNNLFGVDIMEEAVEICKLRLFLKLAAQVTPVISSYNLGIEPLPDIDFNIRAGNTLVGYANYDEVKTVVTSKLDLDNAMETIAIKAADLQKTFNAFRKRQTEGDGSVLTDQKLDLRDRLKSLEDELNNHLATEHGVRNNDKTTYLKWIKSQQPFHWFIEFYGIINAGGFNVIIGNPPYVSAKKVSYLSAEQKSLGFPDIYALFLLRSLTLAQMNGRCGMIVPLSLTFSEDFRPLRQKLLSAGTTWFSSYDNIPAAIFTGVSQRCTIFLTGLGTTGAYTTPMYRWRSAARPHLTASMTYTSIRDAAAGIRGIPKVGSPLSLSVLNAISAPQSKKSREIFATKNMKGVRLGFSQAARNFVSVFLEDPPCLHVSSLKHTAPSKIGDIKLATDDAAFSSLAALLGETYFQYWLTQGDGFDVTGWVIKDYLQSLNHIDDITFSRLAGLGQILHARRHEAIAFKKNAGKFVGNFNYRGLHNVTRRADLVLMSGLGINREAALATLNDVQRILAINQFAGEKGIPAATKKILKPLPRNLKSEQCLLDEIDRHIKSTYGLTNDDYDFLLTRDVVLYEEDIIAASSDDFEAEQ